MARGVLWSAANQATLARAGCGKRCAPLIWVEKGGEVCLVEDAVVSHVVPLFTRWAFLGGIQRRSPTNLRKGEKNECKETQLASL